MTRLRLLAAHALLWPCMAGVVVAVVLMNDSVRGGSARNDRR